MELLSQIEAEGKRRAEAIRAEAEEEARRRLQAAEEELAAWREEALKKARNEIEGEKRLILSRARARAREIVLRAKSEAGERLFRKLREEAEKLREDAKRYKAFLARRLEEAEAEIGGPLVLHVDPRDEKAIKALLKGTEHKIGGQIRTLGGFLATNERGDLLVDNRLETRLEILRQRYRARLAELFGQAEPQPARAA